MIPKKGVVHPLNPAPIFFLFVAMQIERILDKKEKHETESPLQCCAQINYRKKNLFQDTLSLCFRYRPQIFFPQTENAPLEDAKKLSKAF